MTFVVSAVLICKWTLSHYDDIVLCVNEQTEPSVTRPQSAMSYLRAHSRSGYTPQSARPADVEQPSEDLTVPRPAATARDVPVRQ